MADFILIMHNDVTRQTKPEEWDSYISSLRAGKHFAGGSAIGSGVSLKGAQVLAVITEHVGGYMIVNAGSMEQAQSLVQDNPVYRAGGTVEIRNLPRT